MKTQERNNRAYGVDVASVINRVNELIAHIRDDTGTAGECPFTLEPLDGCSIRKGQRRRKNNCPFSLETCMRPGVYPGVPD